MADCGFESDLGNGMKMGLLGLAVGALGWLILGAVKQGRSYTPAARGYQPPPPPPQFPPRSHHRRRP